MNIHIAAHYLKLGYRIRRSHWEPEEYISGVGTLLDKMEVYYLNIWDHEQKKIVEHRKVNNAGICQFEPEDLVADDWEIVIVGIRKEFNKYGNFEYIDESDWDTWESNSSWDMEEDD